MTFLVIAIFYCLGAVLRVYQINRVALFVLICLAALEAYGAYLQDKKKGGK